MGFGKDIIKAQQRRQQLENQMIIAMQNQRLIEQQQAILEEAQLTDEEKKIRNHEKKIKEMKDNKISNHLCFSCDYKFEGVELEAIHCPKCGSKLDDKLYRNNICARSFQINRIITDKTIERNGVWGIKKSSRNRRKELKKEIESLNEKKKILDDLL